MATNLALGYSKIVSFRRLIDDHDYMLWVDGDTIFAHFVALESYIARNVDADLFVAKDLNGINAGVMMFKCSEKVNKFLDAIWEYPIGHKHMWAKQKR